MAIVIRRSKPVTIKRRNREHDPSHVGTGWVYIPGFPPDRLKSAYHCIEVRGKSHVFLWNPQGSLGEEWTCGKWSCSPGVMSPHNYRGECTIVIRSSSTPATDYRPQRRR